MSTFDVPQALYRVTSPSRFSEPRVAIVHYWFVAMRGGERVVERMLRLYPKADLFAHVSNPAVLSSRLAQAKLKTSFINRLPFSERLYQYYLPLMPIALEGFDLSAYDLVISSESGPAKGVITRPDALHVCYCHSPMRYLWDQYFEYRKEANGISRLVMPTIFSWLRQWDVNSSARVDRFAANSRFIRQRIAKVWRRDAEVIHPPVDVGLFTPSADTDPYYLWVGAMVPYKRPDLVIDAFNKNGLPLLMVGTGGMLKNLRARARDNITFVERMDFNALRRAFARARAYIMTAEEDFGITPVEAMASGRPVIAFGRGGALDTVLPDRTGILFYRQDCEALVDAVERLERFLPHFGPADAIEQASNFAPETFDEKLSAITSLDYVA